MYNNNVWPYEKSTIYPKCLKIYLDVLQAINRFPVCILFSCPSFNGQIVVWCVWIRPREPIYPCVCMRAHPYLYVRVFGAGRVVWWSQLVASGLWKPSWWTEHGGLTSVPENERCAFHWISHKDSLLWSLLRLKAEGIWVALCTAFACPVMKYYSPFTWKPIWKDMEMNQTGLILAWISWHKTKDLNL